MNPLQNLLYVNHGSYFAATVVIVFSIAFQKETRKLLIASEHIFLSLVIVNFDFLSQKLIARLYLLFSILQIRQKNNSRAAKLIQGFLSGQVESTPDFLQIEGSLYPLELLIELGLEKLTCDYYYIFLDSQSVGRDELQAPPLVRQVLSIRLHFCNSIFFRNTENKPSY